MAESEDELWRKLLTWKSTLEAMNLKANISQTNVMYGGKCNKDAVDHIKYPCNVCSTTVGNNSIFCTACGKWTHKHCGGLKGSLGKVQDFECSVCKAGIRKQDELNFGIGSDMNVESRSILLSWRHAQV